MIKVSYTFGCDGCHRHLEVAAGQVTRHFVSVTGHDHGIGNWRTVDLTVDECMPEGWSWDPYTSALYCPECMDGIFGEGAEPVASGSARTEGGRS